MSDSGRTLSVPGQPFQCRESPYGSAGNSGTPVLADTPRATPTMVAFASAVTETSPPIVFTGALEASTLTTSLS